MTVTQYRDADRLPEADGLLLLLDGGLVKRLVDRLGALAHAGHVQLADGRRAGDGRRAPARGRALRTSV